MLLTQILLNRRADEYDEERDLAIAAKIKDFYLDDDDGEGGAFAEHNRERIIQMFGDAFCFGGINMIYKC